MKPMTHKLFLLLALSSLAPLGANAATAQTTQIPSQAKLLYQVSGYSMAGRSEDQALTSATASARGNFKTHAEENGINVEYQCATVYYDWYPASVSCRDLQYRYGPATQSCSANVSVDVYCLPRDYSQKIAISAVQACEKEPKPACFSEQYQNMFKKITPTNYFNRYRSNPN